MMPMPGKPRKAAVSWAEVIQTIAHLCIVGGTAYLVGSEAGWW
jgi:hypothetical protein